MNEADELTQRLMEFYERFSSWEHGVVKETGVTLPQMHTLTVLGLGGPMRMKELAESMGITTGTLTVLVDRLEAKQHVCRRPHDSDRRSIIVELTPSGHALFKEHDRLHRRLTEEITSACPPEDRAALLRCLKAMNESF